MKIRTAVAAHILSAIDNAYTGDLHEAVEATKKNGSPLTSEQKAKAERCADFYRDQIAVLLATVPFEGDTAEVPGVAATKPSDTDAHAEQASDAGLNPDYVPPAADFDVEDLLASIGTSGDSVGTSSFICIHNLTVNVGR